MPADADLETVQVFEDTIEAGRAAAQRLAVSWPKHDWLQDAPGEHWARGAIERFAEILNGDFAVLKTSRQGSDQGAESLSPRPFQGLLESLQNADDLGATELRIGFREVDAGRELLIVHNGSRVQLNHVFGMVLPWVTTKGDDPEASGRFGIGQKTLRSMGGPIGVHCAPFHFRMAEGAPVISSEVAPVDGFYAPNAKETLVVVPLFDTVDVAALEPFMARDLGTESLLFLKSVRRVCLIDLTTGRALADHRIVVRERSEVPIRLGKQQLVAERIELVDPATSHEYVRYMVQQPLSDGVHRKHKATGETTTVGMLLPRSDQATGRFFDRLPLPLQLGFPFCLNAQFDPDAARSNLLEKEWNESRLADLGDLVASVALDCFAKVPATGWQAVPLTEEGIQPPGTWLALKVADSIIERAKRRLAEELVFTVGGTDRSLNELVYEDHPLDGLLTDGDFDRLTSESVGLPIDYRDASGRWRLVLDQLGRCKQVSTAEAIKLLDLPDDELGNREPEWFVAMMRAALDADAALGTSSVADSLLTKRSVLLADRRRVEPPARSDPQTLVSQLEPDSLAQKLGIGLPIHPAYLADTVDARRVIGQLKNWGMLVDECASSDAALAILGRSNSSHTIGRVRVEDAELLTLRGAFERVDEQRQVDLGHRIGRNIELRGFSYDRLGNAVDEWIQPAEAYLPAAIEHESESFAKAAYKAPGLHWLHGSYARLLRRVGGRREIGAQKFLVRLGSATAPRLVTPHNETAPWTRDPRPTSPVEGVSRDQIQRLAIQGFNPRPTHLLNDRWSPDLDLVMANIAADKIPKRRRTRGLALVGTLARSWERQYAEHELAGAVYAYNGYWHSVGEVMATWLGRAASAAWLPSQSGRLKPPSELFLPTDANRLAYSHDRASFAARFSDHVNRSPVLAALRLHSGPAASSLVSRLKELREVRLTNVVQKEVSLIYRLLALACSREGRRGTVDDMAVATFRSQFVSHQLLLADGLWHRPAEVFKGQRIFGTHRAFAQMGEHFEALWRVLGLTEPSAADCVEVLRDLAAAALTLDDRTTLLLAMPTLAGKLDDLSTQQRASLKRLPLWLGKEWMRDRPVYVSDDASVSAQAASQVRVWAHPFSTVDALGRLTAAMGVTVLRREDFQPINIDGHGVADGDQLVRRFATAVQHLSDELIRGDHALHQSIQVPWSDLAAARVVVQPDLRLLWLSHQGVRITIDADVHLLRIPLALILRSDEDAGDPDTAGRAIASLFNGDRQKVAWAWGAMWQRAGDGTAPERIILPSEDDDTDDESADKLLQLKQHASGRKAKPASSSRTSLRRGIADRVQVRALKDLDQFLPDEGTVVNPGASKSGLVLPVEKPKSQASSSPTASSPAGTGGGSAGARTVLPPIGEREQLAFEVVRKALRYEIPQLADLRARRGIGADAVDELRQFYEVKMSSSPEFPNDISLTRQEAESAATRPDYFLAVVAGLEEGSAELKVRFIFDPLKRLGIRIKGDMTLTGIREVEALEYRFNIAESPSDAGGGAEQP